MKSENIEEMEKEHEAVNEKRTKLKVRDATYKLALQEDLQDESKVSHFNRLKLLTHWRKIMRLAKTEALKKEIKFSLQNHEREVDAKVAIISMLER